MKNDPTRASAAEIVSISERVGYLQALRVGFAAVVLGSAFFAEKIVGRSIADVLLVSTAYLVLAALVEAIRRGVGRRSLALIGGMLLVDGLYLAWALYATGGTQSPLRFLAYIHLIAVTLLASYRTGLKIALWHSLLFFVVFYAQAADILERNEAFTALNPDSPEFVRSSVFNVMAFWLVAISAAIFSSLNERELRRRKSDFEDLTRMAADLEDEMDPEGVSRVLLDSVCESFGFKRGVVLTPAEQNHTVLAYRGPGDGEVLPGGQDPILRQATEARETQLVKELGPEDEKLQSLLPFAKNLVVTPLLADRQVVALMVLEHPTASGRRIERRVVEMVGQFASHAALAIRNAYLLMQVQKLADTDALTGLANRRSFEKVLAQEISRAERNDDTVTLMMVDVDHFKSFNDNYGHQAGDEILRLMSKALQQSCRDFDTPARYGGEEFAVILPGCPSSESVKVAERLRKLVEEIESVAPVTASAGVATFPTHAGDAEGLINAADEALYQSKEAGRNRVTRSKRGGATRAVAPTGKKASA